MQHEMIPLFSVPLIKMNIGEMDQVSRAWIRGLDYPSQSYQLLILIFSEALDQLKQL